MTCLSRPRAARPSGSRGGPPFSARPCFDRLGDPMPPEAVSAELERLASLARFDVFATPHERAFDDIAGLAAELCATPIALVSFVGETHEWFKARVGLSLEDTPNEQSFSVHAIQQRDIFVVQNTDRKSVV